MEKMVVYKETKIRVRRDHDFTDWYTMEEFKKSKWYKDYIIVQIADFFYDEFDRYVAWNSGKIYTIKNGKFVER